MTLFVLVHGAYHGGWCWDLAGHELEEAGCRWVAPDLPCEKAAGPSDYAATVIQAVSAVGQVDGEDIVVVGHSLGGLTAAVVAEAVGARQLVFLAAVVPEPGRSALKATHPPRMGEFWLDRSARQIVDGGLTRWQDEDAIEIFFHDCSAEVAARAAARLRPQDFSLLREPCPLTALPDTEYHYIACADDRTVTFEWQQEAARRLGVEPDVIPGGHSPFLARPKDLVRVLTGDRDRSR